MSNEAASVQAAIAGGRRAANRDRAAEIAIEAEQHYGRAEAEGKSPGLFIPRVHGTADRNNNVPFGYPSIEDAFPAVDPGLQPFGPVVLVQLRLCPLRTPGGLIVPPEERKTQQDNEQVARVVALGPVAFRNRDSAELWPEGAWCKVGDFVRVPKYQGDYWQIGFQRPDWEYDGRGDRRGFMAEDYVMFATFKDLAIRGAYTGDPLLIRTFL